MAERNLMAEIGEITDRINKKLDLKDQSDCSDLVYQTVQASADMARIERAILILADQVERVRKAVYIENGNQQLGGGRHFLGGE